MRAKDAARVSTLRMLKSAIEYHKIANKQENITDADVITVIKKQIKQRQDSIEGFEKGGRAELVAKEKVRDVGKESLTNRVADEAHTMETMESRPQGPPLGQHVQQEGGVSLSLSPFPSPHPFPKFKKKPCGFEMTIETRD